MSNKTSLSSQLTQGNKRLEFVVAQSPGEGRAVQDSIKRFIGGYLLFRYDEFIDECGTDLDLFSYNGMEIILHVDKDGTTYAQIKMDDHLKNNVESYLTNMTIIPDVFLCERPYLIEQENGEVEVDPADIPRASRYRTWWGSDPGFLADIYVNV